MSLIFGKKGLFLKECQQLGKKGLFLRHFHWKRVIFWCLKSAFLNKRGPFNHEISVKGVFFLLWRTIIRPPF